MIFRAECGDCCAPYETRVGTDCDLVLVLWICCECHAQNACAYNPRQGLYRETLVYDPEPIFAEAP